MSKTRFLEFISFLPDSNPYPARLASFTAEEKNKPKTAPMTPTNPTQDTFEHVSLNGYQSLLRGDTGKA